MPYMSQLTAKTEQELFEDLKGVIFLNPMHISEEDGKPKYLPADEYLSGNVREKDGQPLNIDLLYNSDSVTEKSIAEYLQSEYQSIGVSLNIHGEEEQSYRDNMKAGNFDMVFNICWGTPYDPQSSLAAMRAPVYGDYAAQLGLDDKAEIDDAITEILITTDENRRQELYTYVLTHLHEDAVYIPLTYECNKAIYRSDMKGFHFTQTQYEVPFQDFSF